MDSEKSAESSALTKNKKLMFVTGHRRYVEVIQCSGDEMAVVLQQGLPAPLSSLPQSPASIHAAAAVLPTTFWSLPPPSAQTADLPLLLQQRSAIPLPSAPGIFHYCDLYILVHGQVTIIFVVSVCLFVCLFVCAEFFSAVFDPISIKLGHMLYVWV